MRGPPTSARLNRVTRTRRWRAFSLGVLLREQGDVEVRLPAGGLEGWRGHVRHAPLSVHVLQPGQLIPSSTRQAVNELIGY
jgi:hypothetical protein